MADIKQYVNRSNLATFLAKIKELIPSSSSFLTKTEAEETYQEKLKYYTEGDESNQGAAIQVDYDGGYASGGASAGFTVGKNEAGVAAAGMPITLETVDGDINLITAMVSGDIKLSTSPAGGKAYYNDSEILSESSVVDSLESTSTTAPLSANQGKVLNEKFDDILTKSDVSSNTDVAMLSRMFALPLSSYVGAGLYLPSSDTITKYSQFLGSLSYGEHIVCTYQGVKGIYRFVGDASSSNYSFVVWMGDIESSVFLTQDTGVSSTDIRNASLVSALPSNPSSTTLYLIPE